jgi:zinc/manganese transport system permease protein
MWAKCHERRERHRFTSAMNALNAFTSFGTLIFEPGVFASEPVHTALVVGAGAAIVSGVVGVFTVIKGQSFAGHALGDVSSAGGSASFLLGINPLLGFVTMALLGAAGMEIIRLRRAREGDLATAIVFGAGLGLSALFLYLDVTTTSTTGAAVTVMFGSMFAISPSIVPLALAVGAVALAATALIYRPLLLASLDGELATVRGVHVRLIGFTHLSILAIAVALSSVIVGAVLSTALLIGPAATALRLTDRPGRAVIYAPLIAVAGTWIGILLAYDSYYWTGGHGLPVSFMIVSVVLAFYVFIGRRPFGGRRNELDPDPPL